MSEKQPVVICADDFGLSPKVNEAIFELAREGRISAISCFTHYSDWQQSAAHLRSFFGEVDLGLHLHLGQLSRLRDYQYEIERQVDRFTQILHRYPDFIDGHHHLHQLPRVRRIVIKFLKKTSQPLYSRQTSLEPKYVSWNDPKSVLVDMMGRRFKKLIASKGIPVNDYFTGYYNYEYKSQAEVAALFKQFSMELKGKRPIWRVRPGREDEILKRRSKLTWQRELEYQVLKSNAWNQIVEKRNLRITRFFDSMNSKDFLRFF